MSRFLTMVLCLLNGCEGGYQPPVSRVAQQCDALSSGEYRPSAPEAQVSGGIERPVTRRQAAFAGLVRADSAHVLFKDEEGTGADRLMSPRLREKVQALGLLVDQQWPGVKLRVTEAWDENAEHGDKSLHYEGRAADLTTSDRDSRKLGCLASLAVRAGFDWVYFEGSTHVHASVKR